MRHNALQKMLADRYLEAQATRLTLPLFLMLIPVGVFAGLTYYEVGYVSPLGLVSALAAYSAVLSLGAWVIRRELARGLRPHGAQCQPPEW
jgi:hypothetical protein